MAHVLLVMTVKVILFYFIFYLKACYLFKTLGQVPKTVINPSKSVSSGQIIKFARAGQLPCRGQHRGN